MALTDTDTGTGRTGTFASFGVEHFALVYLSGWIFSTARWGLGFLAAYVVNDLTGSPRLVQLTGTFMWGPLLFAGLIGGALSDRFDRKRLVMAMFGLMVPLTTLMGMLALGGRLKAWMIMPFMLVVGFGWVVDMTARRALVFDLVGAEHLNNAMALEMVSTSIGLATGALIGGSVIQFLGVGQAYLVIAAGIVAATLLMVPVPATDPTDQIDREPFLASLAEGFRALPANRTLVSILGVTVVADFFHFSYTPIVQVIAERVGATPFLTGLLAAGAGFGMMLASLWVAWAEPHRGKVYVFGTVAAFIFIIGFAQFTSYIGVFISLLLASLAFGLFGATQGALVMSVASDEMRGRAMGLLSMAIGALPVGMYVLGELAEAIGAPNAVTAFNLTGLVLLVLWLIKRPQTLSTR